MEVDEKLLKKQLLDFDVVHVLIFLACPGHNKMMLRLYFLAV